MWHILKYPFTRIQFSGEYVQKRLYVFFLYSLVKTKIFEYFFVSPDIFQLPTGYTRVVIINKVIMHRRLALKVCPAVWFFFSCRNVLCFLLLLSCAFFFLLHCCLLCKILLLKCKIENGSNVLQKSRVSCGPHISDA